jgi:hypothetical protein
VEAITVPNPANRLWAYFQILDFIRKLFQGQTNTPAYFNSASVTKQKKFVTWTATNSQKTLNNYCFCPGSTVAEHLTNNLKIAGSNLTTAQEELTKLWVGLWLYSGRTLNP